ncbi:MAG: hypothetical protein KAT65_01640 [Methanophagales archaeon]|nr:hypothetical protein [Methanophagales archaeon]
MKRIAKYIISRLLQRIEFTNVYLDILERRVFFLLEKSSASISVSFVFHIEPDKYVPKEAKRGLYKHYVYPYKYKTVDMLPDYLSDVFCDVKCTLVITNPILEERPNIVKELFKNGHEIGIHPHPQYRPGVDVKIQDNMQMDKFDYNWVYQYIRWHVEKLYEIIGEYPVSHVAADFCFTKDIAKALHKISKDYKIPYIIDSSLNGVPNVCNTYRMDLNNVQKEDNKSNIIEVPVTGDTFSTIGKGFWINWINCASFNELKWFFLNTLYRNLKGENGNIVLTYWGHNIDLFAGFIAPAARRNPEMMQQENIKKLIQYLKTIPNTKIVPLKSLVGSYVNAEFRWKRNEEETKKQ